MNQQMQHDPILNFNTAEHDISRNSSGGGGLPVSDDKGHLVILEKPWEMKPISDPSKGSLICFYYKIVGEGPTKGKTGVHRENIGHTDAETKRIAEEKVNTMMHVIGCTGPSRTIQQVLNRPFRVVVDYQDNQAPGTPGEGNGRGFTNIVKYFDAQGRGPEDPNCGKGGQQQVAQGQAVVAGGQPAGLTPAMQAQPQVATMPQQMPQPAMQQVPQQVSQMPQMAQQAAQLTPEQIAATQQGLNQAASQMSVPGNNLMPEATMDPSAMPQQMPQQPQQPVQTMQQQPMQMPQQPGQKPAFMQ